MKKITNCFIICGILSKFVAYSQISVVTTNVSKPYGLAVDMASHLYISQAEEVNGKISFMFLNDNTDLVFDLFTTNLSRPTRLKLTNDLYLYVSESSQDSNEISRAFLGGATLPTMNTYIAGLVTPMGLEVNNNNVYVGDYGNYAIKKINTSTIPFVSSTLVNDLATDIIIDGEFIYYTNPVYGKILSNTLINPTIPSSELVTGVESPSSIVLHNDFLYISDSIHGKIFRLNIQGSSTNAIEIATGLLEPQSMVVFDNYLYIAEYGANRIIKIDLATLSTKDFEKFDVTIHPNPSSNIINIKCNSEIEEVKIYDSLGKLILKSHKNNQVDIEKLQIGIYYANVLDSSGNTMTKKIFKK